MSISSEITRLQGLKTQIRTKLVALGLTTASADLEDCANAIDDIANNGAVSKTLDATANNQNYTVPAGYHNGSGAVNIVLENKTITANGTYNPTTGKVFSQIVVNVEDAPVLQSKTVTPTESQQNVTADAGYDGLSQVTVNAIPDNYADVSNVTAAAGDVLATKVFVTANGTETTGTMVNNGAVSQTIDGLTVTSYTIPAGYHNGSGTVSLDNTIELALAAI